MDIGTSCADCGTTRDRSILHVDMNCFYASVEQHLHPELRGIPVAVAGDPEKRNGIILAKSPEAKACGVKTGEAIWQAEDKCPGLTVVPPEYSTYMRYSRLARGIYYDYTDQVEPFGLDECWLDITGSLGLFGGDEMLVAEEISERVKAELGLTVSVGVSWNKVFAKFGSDEDRRDGIVRITRRNYRDVVWPFPVRDLLYVGSATERKLNGVGITTIGGLAQADSRMLQRMLGKIGDVLKGFANGMDCSPVKVMDPKQDDVAREAKSVGNGLTAPHDIVDRDSAKALVYLLAESVAQRLREMRMRASLVSISVRDAQSLCSYTRQAPLPMATSATSDIAEGAWRLLEANEPLDQSHPLRGIGVRASRLESMDAPVQLDMFGNVEERLKREKLDAAVDSLRARFGNSCIKRTIEYADPSMSGLDIKRDNIVHPVGFFGE